MDNRENESWYATEAPSAEPVNAPQENNSFLKPEDKTIKIIGTVAAGLYAGFALFGGFTTLNLLVIAAFVLFAVSFYPEKKNLLVIIGSGLYILATVINAANIVESMIKYSMGGEYTLRLIGLLIQLASIIILLLMAISIYTRNYAKADKFYKIWYLPGVLIAVSVILRGLRYSFSLRSILITAAILFVGYDIFKPEIAAYESDSGTQANWVAKDKKSVGTDPQAIEKLQRINKLYKANEITEEEYNKLRNEYINRI